MQQISLFTLGIGSLHFRACVAKIAQRWICQHSAVLFHLQRGRWLMRDAESYAQAVHSRGKQRPKHCGHSCRSRHCTNSHTSGTRQQQRCYSHSCDTSQSRRYCCSSSHFTSSCSNRALDIWRLRSRCIMHVFGRLTR